MRSTGIPGVLNAAYALTAALVLSLGCATAKQATPNAAPTATEATTPTSTPPPAVARPSANLHPVAPPLPGVQTQARLRLAAVGDVLMHGAVKDAAADHRSAGNDEGYGWLWEPVADLLSSPDVTFANLETPIAPRSGTGSRSFVFNAPPAAIRALRHAGVDLVNVANNHMFDQGRGGFEETLAQLDAAGMPYVGAGERGREAGPRLVSANGLTVAFLAYSYGYNQSGNDCAPSAPRCVRASVLDPDRAVADVQAAAREADAVIVSLHWGTEYQQQPREADVALAHRLADAGALAVLGHHPHVLQPIEVYATADGRAALIAYSLGNFVSNQSRNYVHGVTPAQVGATRDGVLLEAEIVRRDYGRGAVRVELAGAAWEPLWTENDTADGERRARGGARPSIQVVSLDRALADVRARLAAFADPVPPGEQARWIKLRQREELYLARRAAIAAAVGEDLEREAPPPPRPAAASATPAPSP